MYTDSAYWHNKVLDFKDKSKPIMVCSCGTDHTEVFMTTICTLVESLKSKAEYLHLNSVNNYKTLNNI